MSEHRAIIDALDSGNAQRANTLMQEHLDAVAGRALIQMKPQKRRDLSDILAAYAIGTAGPAEPRRGGGAERVTPRCRCGTSRRSALSFQTSICTILPSRTTKRST